MLDEDEDEDYDISIGENMGSTDMSFWYFLYG